jgi:DNA-binding transcriptional LysR family regulator
LVPELSVRTIRYIFVLAETQNFGRAAEQLGISTATLSLQVSRLEALLGAPLFERSRRGTTLTPLGAEFLEATRPMLRVDDDLQAWMSRVIGSGGKLRIGIVAGGMPELGQVVLPELRRLRPGVAIAVHSVAFGDVTQELLTGKSDLVVTPAPFDAGQDRGIRTVRLRDLKRILIVPDHHPYARRDALSLEELTHEVFVVPKGVDSDTLAWWLIDPRPDGTKPKTVEAGPDLEGILTMVVAGVGVNLASDDVGRPYERPGLRFIPVSDAPSASLVVAFYVGRRDPLLHDFIALAKRHGRSPSQHMP